MHEQVDDRLKFYETGEAPMKNEDAMMEVLEELKSLAEETTDLTSSEKKKKKKKKKAKEEDDAENEEPAQEVLFVFLRLHSLKDFI